ncbi:importin-11-like isoform X1 [Agrilus planipennis]|uniref:Importin-11 n=1 Tax=Agrilus planipennis TaxID=224129 RepID=A0A7F5RDC4_AGRPL|nr:importin-11-like isoform X1 [Agrilus planipennis]
MDLASTQAMVLDVLQRASSQNSEILKPAEAKLSEWEIQPGFYSVLLQIVTNHSVDVNVRLVAVLYLKSGVDKYWRKNAPNEISEEEKRSLRQGLVTTFAEPVNQIAIQLGVLISKIARFDCPREWPELIPTLIQAIENNDPLIQHRALLILYHVVKALSSKRLAGDRRLFQELSASIFAFILNLWNTFTEAFVTSINHDAATEIVTENLEKALLNLRILRKLTVFGFHKLHEKQDCLCFLKMIFERAKTALECRKQLRGKGIYVLELCEKFIIHLTKVLLSVLDMHPISFVSFIRPTLEFTVFYLFTTEGTQYTYERFIIQCLNLIKGILLCSEYKLAKIPELTKDIAQEANQIKVSFFQPEILTDICRKIVSHYMLLKRDDLELWDADPETFANDEVGESWKYSLRPCVETVFVTLFHEYRDTLAPVMVEMIKETATVVDVHDLSGILKKDAVYNAVGLGAYDLYDEIDFDQWFTNTLVQELKVKDPNYRIIRRRVSRLIGNWTGIKLSTDLRPLLYECIINLLGSDEDMAVRLTTSTTLRHAVDDFEFNAEQFRPYLDTTFNLLFSLLKETTECETKMHVLNVMTLVVERVGQTIQPHTEALIHYLPLLWKESEEHNMLRCAIVSTLVQLVKALGPASAELNPFLLPIIQLGTDTKQGAIVYLLEDCLELWLTVLENTSNMTNQLMQLFDNMPNLLDYSTETLHCCLVIILAHMLIAPELVMKTQGLQLMTACDSLMADMRSEGILMLTRVVENFIRASPNLGCETVKVILPRIFQSIYQTDTMPMLLSMYLSIVARVLLSSHGIFTEIISLVARKENNNEHNVLASILDVWISKMSNVTNIERRKLVGLALVNLLTTQSRPVMERFKGIIERILEVLHDVSKTDENGATVDSLVLTEGQSPSHFQPESENYETDHDQRKKQLILLDPVHNIVLKDYFQSQLLELQRQIGPVNFEQMLQMVDPDVLLQIKKYYFKL